MNNMTEAPQSEKSKKNPQPKKFPWRDIGVFFSTFSVIVLLLLFFGMHYYYLSRLPAVTPNVREKWEDVQQNINQVNQQLQQLNDQVKEQDQIINSLRQTQTGYSRDQWRVVEAEFLTKLANDKLQLEGNIPQAIMLLQAADQDLRDLNNEHLLAIRKTLATDITSLQNVPQFDLPGLYMRLSALNDQLNQLPLLIKQPQVLAPPAINNQSESWWKRGLQNTWQALRQVVVIRYNKNGAPPLLTPEQQEFIYQNLHAALEKAMWGLLHQQKEIYQASLQQAINWIKQYFILDAPATQNALTQLTQFQATDIHPAVPNTLTSLDAFREYFATQNQQNPSG